MKKVLILTYYYKHKNAMASVRSVKLAKYLTLQGCVVTVLTSNQRDTWTQNYLTPKPSPEIREIYAPQIGRWTKIRKYLDHRKKVGQAKLTAQANGGSGSIPKPGKMEKNVKQKLKSYLSWQFYFNLAKQEDICMFIGLKEEYKRKGCPKFDTVIATYPTYGAFLMGIWLKKHGYCGQLIADFRDPLYNPGFRNRKQEADFDKKCLRNILNTADQLVCVSKGIADGILREFPEFTKPVHVITNGFDPDDVEEANIPVEMDREKVHFVYTGALYHGKRCVDMLAGVLRNLIEEGEICADDFSFEYAGADYPELLNQLGEYGLEKTAVDHGFVSREESIALQKHADALLLLTWNEKKYQGVVPGKLFEYMSIGTVPILALVTGDVENSEVAQMITQAQAGFACEAAVPEQIIELKDYVRKLFDRELHFESKVERYSYKTISEQYAKLV